MKTTRACKCPHCQSQSSRVVGSEYDAANDLYVRRRVCNGCEKKFATFEKVDPDYTPYDTTNRNI